MKEYKQKWYDNNKEDMSRKSKERQNTMRMWYRSM